MFLIARSLMKLLLGILAAVAVVAAVVVKWFLIGLVWGSSSIVRRLAPNASEQTQGRWNLLVTGGILMAVFIIGLVVYKVGGTTGRPAPMGTPAASSSALPPAQIDPATIAEVRLRIMTRSLANGMHRPAVSCKTLYDGFDVSGPNVRCVAQSRVKNWTRDTWDVTVRPNGTWDASVTDVTCRNIVRCD